MRRVLVISLDVFGKFADLILCRGINFIDGADKGLGGFEKNTRYFILVQLRAMLGCGRLKCVH